MAIHLTKEAMLKAGAGSEHSIGISTQEELSIQDL
jgi:hypothetical protein